MPISCPNTRYREKMHTSSIIIVLYIIFQSYIIENISVDYTHFEGHLRVTMAPG